MRKATVAILMPLVGAPTANAAPSTTSGRIYGDDGADGRHRHDARPTSVTASRPHLSGGGAHE
jgi:hypothetical protein